MRVIKRAHDKGDNFPPEVYFFVVQILANGVLFVDIDVFLWVNGESRPSFCFFAIRIPVEGIRNLRI